MKTGKSGLIVFFTLFVGTSVAIPLFQELAGETLLLRLFVVVITFIFVGMFFVWAAKHGII